MTCWRKLLLLTSNRAFRPLLPHLQVLQALDSTCGRCESLGHTVLRALICAVSTPATPTCIPAFITAWVIDTLPVIEQAETREVILNALEKSGLRRTQQGEALVLTVHDVEQEMQIEEIGMQSLKAFAKLYTVHALKLCQMLYALWHVQTDCT